MLQQLTVRRKFVGYPLAKDPVDPAFQNGRRHRPPVGVHHHDAIGGLKLPAMLLDFRRALKPHLNLLVR